MAGIEHLGKRGRDSPEEQWRELARTVPATLLRVATSESASVLRRVKSICRRIRKDMAAGLRQAHRGARRGNRSCGRVVKRLSSIAALHEGVDIFSALALCAELAAELKLGDGGDPEAQELWQKWREHRAEVAGHAGEAQKSMRSAMAYLGAATRVLDVVSRRQPESRLRVAWASEAGRLLNRAMGDLTAARCAVKRMRHAVFLEFFVTWMILGLLDALGCA